MRSNSVAPGQLPLLAEVGKLADELRRPDFGAGVDPAHHGEPGFRLPQWRAEKLRWRTDIEIRSWGAPSSQASSSGPARGGPCTPRIRMSLGTPSRTTPLTRPLLHPGELENGGCLGPVLLGGQSERSKTETGPVRKYGENPRDLAVFGGVSLITKNPTVSGGVFMVDQVGRVPSNFPLNLGGDIGPK